MKPGNFAAYTQHKLLSNITKYIQLFNMMDN